MNYETCRNSKNQNDSIKKGMLNKNPRNNADMKEVQCYSCKKHWSLCKRLLPK